MITGSSRGIGAATARRLGAEGYAVCVNYVSNREAAESVVAEVRRSGAPAIAVQADVAVEAEVERLFDTAARELGGVSVLVNNAGILFRQSRLEGMRVDRLQRIFATNVLGAMFCCQQAVRHMSNRHGGDGGVIVNVSSTATKYGSGGEYVDYAATKGALETLTLGLAVELADEGIRVNGVRPGMIYTDIHADGGEPDRVDRMASILPIKRGGHPEEVASAIAWLVSDESSYTTGSFVEVSGGR